MSNPNLARLATLEIKRPGAEDFVDIDGITDVTFNPTRTTADVRHHGTQGAPLKLGDAFDFECSGSGVYMDDDDGQDDLLACIESGETAEYRYRPLGNEPGSTQKVFSGIATEKPTESPNEGGATFSFSIEGTGSVATTAVPSE